MREPRQAGSAGLRQTTAALSSAPRLDPRLGERFAERGLLSRADIPRILKQQKAWGCRFGEVLVACGRITPYELGEALAEQMGVAFVDLLADPPDETLCEAARIDLYLSRLFVPWRRIGGQFIVACADPGPDMFRVIADIYGPRARIVITAKFDVTRTVQRLFRESLSHDAIFRLDERAPRFSARRPVTPPQWAAAILGALLLAIALALAPGIAGPAVLAFLSVCYVANLVFRVALFWAGGSSRSAGYCANTDELAALDERSLPVFSILVPMYREAGMVEQVAEGLCMLDYPAAKLDIKLVLEDDDLPTIAAAKDLRLDGRFEILRVPASEPRTKPKACNYALRFARGTYVVIYDAEDRPEPDQLRKVAAAFRAAPRDVAGFQARLNFYNARENWLTRMFALEYALWFDFLLPGLARFGVPIPLGGTSNHFRADILRELHGWDAFNVTEDADLGMRLAQQGYRVLPIDSSTYEEANQKLGNWIRQRSRWLKGYMQTALVHLRAPGAFARAVGAVPFAGFVLFIGGAIFTSLASPIFWGLFIYWLCTGVGPFGGLFGSASLAVSIAGLIIGNGLLTVLAMLAPMKRQWLSLSPYGITVFAYWLLISAAAYKALWQLAVRPFYWEKTDHGMSRPRPASPKPRIRLWRWRMRVWHQG